MRKRLFEIIEGAEDNCRGNRAIVDMKKPDKLRALKNLLSELEKGEVSARKEGWISIENAEKRLGL